MNGVKLYDKTYFKNSLLKSIQTPNGAYSFDYDASQRLTKAVSLGYTIENTYETATDNPANGLRTAFKETLGAGTFTTRYAYDSLQRLTTLTAPDNTAYQYFFNEKSQPVRQESQMSVQLHEFDEDGQLTAQTVLARSPVQYRYAYDKSGQVVSYTAGNKTHRYTYDAYNRLVKWHNGSKETLYHYDAAGNLQNPQGRTLSFNAANEVVGFTYDREGNLLDDGRLTHTWDGLGRLASSTDRINGSQVSYTYHPDGLRKTKTVGSATHQYHYDGSQLVRITETGGRTVWSFTWNNSKLVQVTNAAGQSFEAVTNHRGDVVRLIDRDGLTAAEYDYDPWGNLVSPEPTDARIKGQPIRYAGYVYDTETKLYYLQARYYDPATARFLSRDPDPGDEDDPVTMNGYTYADGNPVMNTDPDGHWAWMVVNAGFAAYDGYQAYKSGKSKKQIAWAAASSLIGIGKIKGLTKVTKTTGTYMISYSNGYKYIGKGSMKRAKKSAKKHQRKDGAQITSIAWRPAKNSREAFIRGYKLMKKHGFYLNSSRNLKKKGHRLYNKISSPGRKYHYQDYGKY
ncbi:RHS repeat domain-containing protein [Bhargavaea cecembensis]|uniref:RHS repeat domain-containing protein n=1 Tax=Bhargavaea cecembensis TaxID=394098 RepID=UPI000694BD32|nr:RHS repeat-associated core domain-containing protein [Bhargavaea cecembensis]